MNKSMTLAKVRIALKDKVVRPGWLNHFGKVTEVREVPVNKTKTMFLAYLDNGIMVNVVTLKDKDNKFVLDNIGGELESTYKDEG